MIFLFEIFYQFLHIFNEYVTFNTLKKCFFKSRIQTNELLWLAD